MPGARSAVNLESLEPTKPKIKRKRFKRANSMSARENSLVEDVIANSPGGLTPKEENALAVVLRRSRALVKESVELARDTLADRAGRYADIHLQTTEAALENGDAKSLEVAARASQWAMENINVEGTGVVEKPTPRPLGPQINIGIKLGGLVEPKTIEIIEAKVDEKIEP